MAVKKTQKPLVFFLYYRLMRGGGGGVSDFFLHTYRLGFKILNFNIFFFFFFFFFFGGGGGYEDFVDIFWGVTTKLAYI